MCFNHFCVNYVSDTATQTPVGLFAIVPAPSYIKGIHVITHEAGWSICAVYFVGYLVTLYIMYTQLSISGVFKKHSFVCS